MGEFNTQLTMRDIFRKISETQPHLSDLYYTTFYYRKLVRMLREQSKLVLFGAGKYGEIVFAALEQEGIDTIQCFCDNNDRVVETLVHGLEVLSPQDALKCYPDACFVITPKDYDNEILRQLIHMGVDIENIVIFNIKNTGLMVEI
ncbi:MAG: hypothetical protein K2I96_03860 [Lachnospiraceae bacterium]|nr:hypothetical protein [Lachnospiraceae bacterium]